MTDIHVYTAGRNDIIQMIVNDAVGVIGDLAGGLDMDEAFPLVMSALDLIVATTMASFLNGNADEEFARKMILNHAKNVAVWINRVKETP